MTDLEQLRAENEQLREQVEGFRQRELADLREQLASAKTEAAHFRAEAERNAEVGRQIYAAGQEEIGRLKDRIQTLERLPNGRPQVRVGPA